MQTAESRCVPNPWSYRSVSVVGRSLEKLPGVNLPLLLGPVESCRPMHRPGESSDERGWRSSPYTQPEYCQATPHQRTHRYWHARELWPTLKSETAVSNHKSKSEATQTVKRHHSQYSKIE